MKPLPGFVLASLVSLAGECGSIYSASVTVGSTLGGQSPFITVHRCGCTRQTSEEDLFCWCCCVNTVLLVHRPRAQTSSNPRMLWVQ